MWKPCIGFVSLISVPEAWSRERFLDAGGDQGRPGDSKASNDIPAILSSHAKSSHASDKGGLRIKVGGNQLSEYMTLPLVPRG